jgi:hypothetical protein
MHQAARTPVPLPPQREANSLDSAQREAAHFWHNREFDVLQIGFGLTDARSVAVIPEALHWKSI